MQWLAYTIGAFYVFGGAVAIRAGRTNRLLDRAIGRLILEKTPIREQVRSLYAFVVGALTLVSGGALLLLSRWAVAVFLLCAIVQATYLVWATRALPPATRMRPRVVAAASTRSRSTRPPPRWWSGST